MSGDTALSPVPGFITPFLARKGDGGLVERAVRSRPAVTIEGLEANPLAEPWS